jgi:hypothetical protein
MVVNRFLSILHHNRMHEVKIAIASKAKDIYGYKLIKRKLLNCNANIFFNQWCLQNSLTPKYANIKIPNTTESLYFLLCFIYQPEDTPPRGSKHVAG